MGGGATFSRLASRPNGNTIDGPTDDAEFDNIIDNLDPTGIGDQSDSDGVFQTQVDPFPGSVISKPTDLAGELYRLRYEIADIKGTTYHYQVGNATLNKLYAGEIKLVTKTAAYTVTTSDGVILADASGTTFAVTLMAASGNEDKLIYVKKTDSSANVVTVDANASELIDGIVSHHLRKQHDFIVLVCDGTSWHVIAESERTNILEYKNLEVKNNASNPTYQMDVDATALDLETSNGVIYRALGVNLTIDLTASGANGLDTGSEASGTIYAYWVIYNPTTNIVAGLVSVSFTSPTMPSGYTYKRLVSFARNDGSSNLLIFYQLNDFMLFDAPEDDTQVITTGTDATFTDVDCSNFAGDTLLAKAALIGIEAFTTTDGSSYYCRFRPNGSSATNGKLVARLRKDVGGGNYGQYQAAEAWVVLDSSLIFEYKATSGLTINAWLHGLRLSI